MHPQNLFDSGTCHMRPSSSNDHPRLHVLYHRTIYGELYFLRALSRETDLDTIFLSELNLRNSELLADEFEQRTLRRSIVLKPHDDVLANGISGWITYYLSIIVMDEKTVIHSIVLFNNKQGLEFSVLHVKHDLRLFRVS